MAKQNEILDELADELNDMKGAFTKNQQEVAGLKQSVDALTQALNAKSEEKQLSEQEKKTALRNALVDCFDFLKKQNNLTKESLLPDIDYIRFAGIAAKHYCQELEKARKAVNEEDLKEAEEEKNKLIAQRTAQGIETVEQVQEWAPDYPPEIQRTIRYIGRRIVPENETPESTHKLLRVWGDALLRITMMSEPEPPTFMAWAKYRLNKFWKSTDKWSAFRWYVVLLCLIAIVTCINWYQSSVMDLDRTNRLFYKHVIRTEQGRKDYHELDSLIHDKSFFKTYRTLDK